MITLQEWKLIGITLFVIFFISAIVLGIISEIATRLKNKAQKNIKKQITRKCMKIDYNAFLISKMEQEFIGHRKMLLNELIRF